MGPLILAVALVIGPGSPAQESLVKVLGGAKLDRGVHVSPTRDGGYVAVGVTRSSGSGGDDVYLVRTDSSGEPLWTTAIGGTGQDNGWSGHETRTGFLVAGYTNSFGAGGIDFYLLKTSRDGVLQWSRTYGGPADDYCWALAPTRDGGAVLAGETKSYGAGAEDFYLIKVDATGAELWSQTYGGSQGDRCFSVAPIKGPGGGYMLAGQTYSSGAGDRDVFVIKTKANGDEVWSRTFGGAGYDVGHCISGTSDGSFLVTGYTTSFGSAGEDPYLIKINVQGRTHWKRVIPIEGTSHTITGEQAADGGFYLVGFSHFPSSGQSDALLVKTTPDGQLDWFRNVLPTISGESFGYTVRATSDGGCVFTGHTTVGSAGGRDLLLVKVAGQ